MAQDKNKKSWSESSSQSTSKTTQTSQTQKTLDQALVDQIMSGFIGQMTDDEIRKYAESLLNPQLNAGLEAAKQNYETLELAKKQEQENLAATLARSIQEQQSAYQRSAANVETAALARGMGRSSYTMQSLANQGNALAEAVRQLTTDNARQQNQIQQQISQAAQQTAQTTGRLNTDYASQLAAKIQEIRQNQQNAYNSAYMTAVSGALGSKTTGGSSTSSTGKNASVSGDFTEPNIPGGEKKKSSGGSTLVTVNQKV